MRWCRSALRTKRRSWLALRETGLGALSRVIGRVVTDDRISIRDVAGVVLVASRTELRRAWSETSHLMQSLRDNPDCAREEYERATDALDPGLFAHLSYDPADDVAAPYIQTGVRPRVAILREQGVNSQMEMAAAFHRAGFEPLDVHMTDLIAGRVHLDDFRGLVACGGFSYGDVLGAGEGWAKSILFNAQLRDLFSDYFVRPDTFTLGVCNGCQMLSTLKSLIPGTDVTGRASCAIAPSSSRVASARRGAADALVVLRRHGGQRAADRGRARRGPGRVRRHRGS